MKALWTNFTQHPKTSVMGLLFFVGLTAQTIKPYFPKWVNALTLVDALCAAYLGAIMKDGGTQLAILQGETEPKGVPSHEVPDQLGTKVVKP